MVDCRGFVRGAAVLVCASLAGLYVYIYSMQVSIHTVSRIPLFPQFLLILAYMRSGSSLTGDVMQLHNDTIYSFEPLFNIWKGNLSTFANGNQKVYKLGRAERVEESLKQLNAWYRCLPMDLDLETMKYLFMGFSRKLRLFGICMNTFAATNITRLANQKCIVSFIRLCKTSKVRIVKTIRLSVRDVEPLIKRMPNFKIIHLIRDPRAILLSRHRVNASSLNQRVLKTHAKKMCEVMVDNYRTISSLNKKYPGRIKRLRYEEIATAPVNTVRNLYKFVSLNVTETIIKNVNLMTTDNRNIEKDYNTRRKNSTVTANAWRAKMDFKTSQVIDSVCKEMYSAYGYIPAKNKKQLKNILKFRLWIDIHT